MSSKGRFVKFLPKERGTYFIESGITEFKDIVDCFYDLGKYSGNTIEIDSASPT